MKIITLGAENIEKEHICCALSNNNDIQVASKKSWLAARFSDGLVFKKCDVRGKCFIEYIPAENAWAPIDANEYMYINCLWVSGQFKGQGNSNLLLEECIADSKAKGKKGLVILSSEKKMSYLSDSNYLKYKGFKIADYIKPYFTLMYLPFEDNVSVPKFKIHVDQMEIKEDGVVVYYTSQCPFTAKYVPLLEKISKERGINFKAIHLQNKEEAQNAPTPFTTYSIFLNGKFVTHEILTEKKFEKLIATIQDRII
ncbi:MAG: YoaP domain-containing protein [Bacilli bacterium]